MVINQIIKFNKEDHKRLCLIQKVFFRCQKNGKLVFLEPFKLKQNEYDLNSTFKIFLSNGGVDYDRDDFGDLILDYEKWGTINPDLLKNLGMMNEGQN